MAVVVTGGKFRWWSWFCWLMGGWFYMHKFDIAVANVVLDDGC